MQLEDVSILYAEDEHGIQETVCDVLELYVNQVITAQDGREALELYKLYKPSILLLDICMPKLDGLELLKIIREEDIHTPVIIMTAHTEKEYLLSAVELYITKYLVKPFDKNALLDALNACLRMLQNNLDEQLTLRQGLTYESNSHTLIKDGESIRLNKKEALLLNLFLQHPNKILRYEELEYHVWQDVTTKDALKSLIKDLRKKTDKTLIKNISGVGYKFEAENV